MLTPADLVETHTRMVYAIAHDQHAKLGGELDDLVGDGMVALCEAAQRFDPELGAPFGEFARKRVAGAMIDAYRLRHGRGRRVQVLLTCDGDVPDVRQSGSAEDRAMDRLALEDVLERVAELPPTLRELVDTVVAGGTWRPIATRDGVSDVAVSQRWAIAKKWLRNGRPDSGRYAVSQRRQPAA